MRRIDGGRTVQAFGPCDQYGDPLPLGVSRIDMIYRAVGCEHHIVLDHAEAVMLRDELQHAVSEIEANRRVAVETRNPQTWMPLDEEYWVYRRFMKRD